MKSRAIEIDRRPLLVRVFRQKLLLAMVIPTVIWLCVFCYYPMYGLIIAFKEYNVGIGILGSQWAGLRYFREVFSDPFFFNAFGNTMYISLLKLLAGFPIPILFALMLNELHGAVRYKKTVQTLSYMPHFLSWAFVANFVISFFSDTGVYNTLLKSLGIINTPVAPLTNATSFLAIIVFSDIWKSFGFSSIIFLAAITSVDPEQYEAALIDGATRLQQVLHITLPAIKPTIIIVLILNISTMVNGNFEQMYLLMNKLVKDRADILGTYTYEIGIKAARYSYATAVGMFSSVVSFVLLFSANTLSRKLADTSLF